MELPIQPEAEFLPPTRIGVETALSRYPCHRLAKHGNIAIDIHEKTTEGETAVKWEVNYIGKFGHPGPLAYKLDTLIINRRIEEATRPIPRVIRLGSLNEICRELGQMDGGKNTNQIKNALRQNAFAAITAKIRYKAKDGSERNAEIDDTRYGVVFTGQKLPDGRKADSVYIVLHDFYMEILNNANIRPLDYDYLKSLPPAPQRFYELLSYQMYAAIRNDRPRAKLRYSELCTYAPLTRHLNWENARSQLAKIHRPHKASGYIAKFDTQDTTDSHGKADWILLYQPGPKARAEFRAFTKRGGPVTLEVEPFVDAAPSFAASQELTLPLAAPEPSPEEAALIGHGITPAKAAELARQHDAETINTYVEYLEFEIAKKPGKIDNPAAWLFTAFKDGRSKPKGFTSREERQRREDERRAKQQADTAQKRRERQEEAAIQKRNRDITAYWEGLTPEEQARLEADSIAQADAATLAMEKGPMKKMLQQARRNGFISQILDAGLADA